MVSFKELCGLTPVANMKQCILTVSTWLMNSERSLRVTVDLSESYPTMEAQGPVPELLRKVLNAYDMVNIPHTSDTNFENKPKYSNSCSYLWFNFTCSFTCSSPSYLHSCKNTAFFTAWHWQGPERGCMTVCVHSSSPTILLCLLPPSLPPLWLGGSRWHGSWLREVSALLTSPPLRQHRQQCGDITSDAAPWTNLIYSGFYAPSQKQGYCAVRAGFMLQFTGDVSWEQESCCPNSPFLRFYTLKITNFSSM